MSLPTRWREKEGMSLPTRWREKKGMSLPTKGEGEERLDSGDFSFITTGCAAMTKQ